MQQLFKNVALLGCGLIGGSLGLEMKKRGIAKRIIGYSRSQANLNLAKKRGLIHEGSNNLKQVISKADFIILASPLLASLDQLQMIAHFAKPNTLVMDVGSTKFQMVRKAEKIFPQTLSFIGAHPMAGSEKSGPLSAYLGLFKGKPCILTPGSSCSKLDLIKIKKLWNMLGSNVVIFSSLKHYQLLSTVSHLPQVISSVLFATVTKLVSMQDLEKLSGNGFKDTTRIAASDSLMWRDIFVTNRNFVLKSIHVFEKELKKIQKLIRQKNAAPLYRYLSQVSSMRRGF